MRTVLFPVSAAILLLMNAQPDVASAQDGRLTVLAIFAHPDDERIVGPLLARYGREGHSVHLAIATDGSKGVRDHAGIPAGEPLARARVEETVCATRRLGIHPPFLFGLEDAGLASFASLGRLRDSVSRLFRDLRPDVVITFGPEGGTGHPDHRLVGNVVTEVVQSGVLDWPKSLYYPSLSSERMTTAPPARPTINSMAARYLPVRVGFQREDLVAAQESFACHRTQYTPDEMAAINAALAHGFDGAVHLRSWYGGSASGRDLPR